MFMNANFLLSYLKNRVYANALLSSEELKMKIKVEIQQISVKKSFIIAKTEPDAHCQLEGF